MPMQPFKIPTFELPLFEGGLLTCRTQAVPHVHIQQSDSTFVFGAAIRRLPGPDSSAAHVWEHAVMRHRVGDSDLISFLERTNTRRWWYASTTAQCISLEIGSYTLDCLRRSAAALADAILNCAPTANAFYSETDSLSGRMSMESSVTPSVRRTVLERAASALLDMPPDVPEGAILFNDVLSWHLSHICPSSVLWFTYGEIDCDEAFKLLSGCLKN